MCEVLYKNWNTVDVVIFGNIAIIQNLEQIW